MNSSAASPAASTTLNLVHESETQRQHVRASVPGALELTTAQGPKRYKLTDLSGGGFAFESREGLFKAGQNCVGRIHLKLETISVGVPVRFDVRYVDAATGRVGVRFDQLDASAVATLRRVVGGFLGGELVGAGELMHTLSRNNFVAARSPSSNAPPRGPLARFRALAQTTLILMLGTGALIYTGGRVSEKLFGANSSAARVSGPRFQVVMPRDGVFRSLIPADGIVKKGSPIGSFETSMFGLVNVQALEAQLTPQEVEALLGREIKGTVTSPCDCRVTGTYATDGQFVGKGQQLADLAPIDFEPYVVARFGFREAERLLPGTPVTLRINGEAMSRTAHIAQLRHDGDPDALREDVVVTIKPEQPLPMELVSRPAQVSAAGTSWLSAKFNDLGDMTTAHAETPAAGAQP